jgi:hypothetical protein
LDGTFIVLSEPQFDLCFEDEYLAKEEEKHGYGFEVLGSGKDPPSLSTSGDGTPREKKVALAGFKKEWTGVYCYTCLSQPRDNCTRR